MDDDNRPLRELFERLDAKELDAMQNRRDEESFNLDFKCMDPSGEPSDADKANLSKAISGYANSAGGIILWGVESKSDKNRKDRSRFQSIIPVKDGDRAVVRFHELTATATQPPVSGVVHRAIAVPGGFVIKTFVPSSDGSPHRTNLPLGQYYRRDADSFRAMQHHEIADMFGRRARPSLQVVVSALKRIDNPEHMTHHGLSGDFRLMAELHIENTGRAMAHHVSVHLLPVNDSIRIWDFASFGDRGFRHETRVIAKGAVVATQAPDLIIHPGTRVGCCPIAIRTHAMGSAIAETPVLRWTIFGEGMPSRSGTCEIAMDDVRRASE